MEYSSFYTNCIWSGSRHLLFGADWRGRCGLWSEAIYNT